MRVPFLLLFGFNKGTKKKKGKRVLLENLVNVTTITITICSGVGARGVRSFKAYKV